MPVKKLNIRQEKFCQKYHECGIAVEAMLYAYPSRVKWKREAQDNAAYKLLQNGEILARLQELRTEMRERSFITKERVLEELAKIGFVSWGDCHSSWEEIMDFSRLTSEQKSAIKSVSARRVQLDSGETVENVRIEFHDKIKAIERICKMLGFDSPTELNVNKVGDDMSREDMLKEIERLEKLRNND